MERLTERTAVGILVKENYEKEIAEMFLKAFDDSEEKISCNCKHNSNSIDNEPCCRCDSKVSENDDTKNKVTSLEIIVRMIDNKPYYEIKYKKVGEDYYHVGYSSFNIDNVLKWRDECFELVDAKVTNADRIRNMSDEELADYLSTVTSDTRVAIKALEEVEQYRAIGTVEKCLHNKDFLDFLADKMNPNDFETYLRLYNALEENGN